MTILLDTQAVLWFWWNDPRLSPTAMTRVCNAAERKLVSPATPWEVAIKVSLKKLDIGGPYPGFFAAQMARSFFEWLPITDAHLSAVAAMPFHHMTGATAPKRRNGAIWRANWRGNWRRIPRTCSPGGGSV